METVFATHNGCVRNTAVVSTVSHPEFRAQQSHHEAVTSATPGTSGLGGQIGELTAALNIIGWNHNQVPASERSPASETILPAASAGVASGLGGQIGELTAALETIGWNHHQVPAEERIPVQERT